MENQKPNNQNLTRNLTLLVIVLIAIIAVVLFKFNPKFLTSLSVSQNKSISMSEVAKHADTNSCWMVIEDKVYDVTKFIPSHPGLDDIVAGCGRDATAMFNTRPKDNTTHSDRAKVQLDTFQIGDLSH